MSLWKKLRYGSGDVKLRSLQLAGKDLYLEDIQGEEEIEFKSCEELRNAYREKNEDKLLEIHRRSPTSSDSACLLAEYYSLRGRNSDAEQILYNSLDKVKLKSHIAEALGEYFLFNNPDFLSCLYWLLRSAIAQRKKPYLSGTYIYLYAVLSALNEYWFGALDSHAKKCKSIADRVFGPGGIGINYSVIQQLEDMYLNMPDVDISSDLKNALKQLGIY
jgi:hypothetical protein